MSRIDINLQSNSYPIYIEAGLLDEIGHKIREIYNGKKIVIVTDENVSKYYGEKLINNIKKENYEVSEIVLIPGEKTKCIEELTGLYNKFLDLGLTRSDLIIAFGGGVIGDLTGFAAATYLRGVNLIQIPTSLIAQIDSSIGGKVAVDLPRGKNLIGNFYHPKAVFIDPLMLKTLEKRFLYDGMAEVIKYGAIRDKDLFNNLMNYKNEEELFKNIEYVIETCCNIKKQVVENDEKDTGERMILNFGHTLGHVVEKYFNFEKYTHGEAVAIGMNLITAKSEELSLTEEGTSQQIKNILVKYNLPYEVEMKDKNQILNTISLDKKSSGKNINLVIIKKIGEVFLHEINKDELNKFI